MCSKLPSIPGTQQYMCVCIPECMPMYMCSCVHAHLYMCVLETKDQYQVSFLRSHPSYF